MRRGATLVLAGLVLASCGTAASSRSVKLTVLAAASLSKVFPAIGSAFTQEHPGVTFAFSIAGTDELMAQIRQGAPADVFAGAGSKYGDLLATDSLIDPYKTFCTNRLVLITPASNPAGISGLGDLAGKPAKLVIGSPTVPIGSYTRTVLAKLDASYGSGYSRAVLRKVVSNEASVTAIVAKVAAGEADAGFVYVTDALSAGSKVSSIALPASVQAVATYPIAVVKTSTHTDDAEAFVDFVMSAPAQRLLKQAGFGPPP